MTEELVETRWPLGCWAGDDPWGVAKASQVSCKHYLTATACYCFMQRRKGCAVPVCEATAGRVGCVTLSNVCIFLHMEK